MKSSTIGRSALSKETMDVIENLAEEKMDYNSLYNEEDNTPNEYYREEDKSSPQLRESKSKEIDLLWQSFKPSRFNTNSPLMCYIGGILTGIVATVLILALFGTFTSKNVSEHKSVAAPIEAGFVEENEVNQNEVQTQIEENSVEQDSSVSETGVEMQKYVIKDGDTVEGIIKHFYGAYTPERAQAIMKANNLKNLDRISIDQVLLIPAEK